MEPYIPYKVRLRQERIRAESVVNKEDVRRQCAQRELTGLLRRVREAGNPNTNRYIELLRPATYLERIFEQDSLIYNPGAQHKWKVGQVILGYHLPSSRANMEPYYYADESRQPAGHKRVVRSTLLAPDGRYWSAEDLSAPNTVQVFNKAAGDILTLNAESLEMVYSALAKVTNLNEQ